ncbi:MAG: CoA transferase [Pseudomonadota bacterium]
MSDTIKVVEIASGAAPAYAAKLLGDQGADVIKVEPTEGDPIRQRGPFPNHTSHPERSGTFLALNTNKRGVSFDYAAAPERLQELIGQADILVHGLAPAAARALGLDAQALAEGFPQLVTLAITPFGSTGPCADYAATELTVAHAGGWANLCPATSTDPEQPPLKVHGHHCAYMTATCGALTALAVLRDVQAGGAGEFIDLSMQAYVASVLEAGVPAWSYRGDVMTRSGERGLIPWRIFQTRDAPVFLVCIEQDQWQRLVEFMGNPDWATTELFAENLGRKENQDLVHGLLQEFIAPWKSQDLYHAAQARRICIAPIHDLHEIAVNDHLLARDAFAQVTHPSAGRLTHLAPPVLRRDGRARIRRAAPLLGEHNDDVLGASFPGVRTEDRAAPPGAGDRRPLEGVRVLDLTWVWAGTFGSLQLAHLGADVIRCESAERPDLYRRLPIWPEDYDATLNSSGMFNQWNQGKRSVAANLSHPDGIEIIRALVAQSDVVIQNFATGVLERLGLGYEALRAIKPDIILASVSGYGQAGPLKDYIAYGPAIPPLSGHAATTGYVNGGPEEMGLSMPDPTAGITAALAIVEALLRRDATGAGDHLDVSMWEATGAFGCEAWMQFALDGTQPARDGNRDPHMCPHGVFRCAGDDAWVAIACENDAQWHALAGLLQIDELSQPRLRTFAARKADEAAIEQSIGAWTAGRDRWAVTSTLQAIGVAAFPTLTTADVVDDAQLAARGFIERLAHPEMGARAHTGIPWLLRNRPNGVRTPAPCLGADTNDILQAVLDYDPTEIARLRERGALS